MMSSHTFLMEHMNFGVHPSKTREDTVKIDISGSQTGGSGQCVRGEGRTLDTDQTDSLWRWTTDGQGSSERLHNDEKRISTKYQCTDKVTVLGLVCEKNTERVIMVR